MRILVVDDAYDGQTVELRGVRGGQAVPVTAVTPAAAAPTWAQVLVAGAASGTTSPRVTDGVPMYWEVAGVEDGFIRALGGSWLFQAHSTNAIGEPATHLQLFGGNSARDNGGDVQIGGGTSGGPGTIGGSVRIAPGNAGGGTNGSVEIRNGVGILVETIADGGVAWGAGVPALSPAVVGARGGNAALASLLTTLAGMGLITDNTTP